MTAILQMDGLSRAYAKSGYLGIFFTKVYPIMHTLTTHTDSHHTHSQISNSLLKVCRSELESFCTNKGHTEDQLWVLIDQAIKNTSSKEHPLITKLNSCLTLGATYKDQFVQLKESLLQSVSFGLGANSGPSRHTVGLTKRTTNKGSSETSQTSLTSVTTSGISLHNIDIIMSNYNTFTARIIQVLDIIATLRQFKQLNKNSRLEGLPRISGLWHLELESGTELSSIQTSSHSWGELAPTSTVAPEESVHDDSNVTMDYLEGLLVEGLQPPSDGLPLVKEENRILSSPAPATHINEGIPTKTQTHHLKDLKSSRIHF